MADSDCLKTRPASAVTATSVAPSARCSVRTWRPRTTPRSPTPLLLTYGQAAELMGVTSDVVSWLVREGRSCDR